MKRYLGVALSVILIAAVAIVAIFVAGNKAEKAVAAVAESHIDQVASAEADAASIRAQAQADADAIRAQAQADAEEIRAEAEVQVEEEEAFFFEEAESDEAEDESAFEQVTVDGQQVFVGDQESVIDYLSSLDRQDWLELATINRCAPFYARVLPWQSEVVRDCAFVSAYRMTKDQCEYAILRDGALLVEDANGNVTVDNSTTKVAGVSDREYPRAAYAAEAEALYEGKTKAAAYTQVNAMGSLKVSCGFDTQEMFKALVVAEGNFVVDGQYVHGYFVAWRIVEGSCGQVNNPPHDPDPTPTPDPTPVPPTVPPTTEPTQQPTPTPTPAPTSSHNPADVTPEPTQGTDHNTADVTPEPTATPEPVIGNTPEPVIGDGNTTSHNDADVEPEVRIGERYEGNTSTATNHNGADVEPEVQIGGRYEESTSTATSHNGDEAEANVVIGGCTSVEVTTSVEEKVESAHNGYLEEEEPLPIIGG